MSDTFLDKFIADLIKGAEASEGFMRGSKATVEVSREHRGHEEKLAHLSPGAASLLAHKIGVALPVSIQEPLEHGLSSLLGFATAHPNVAAPAVGGLGGALAGAAGADEGHRLEGAGRGALAGVGLGLAGSAAAKAIMADPQLGYTLSHGAPPLGLTVGQGGPTMTRMAMDTSTLLGGVPIISPDLSGLNATARDASMSSGAATGISPLLGQLGGGLAGATAGHALDGLSDHDRTRLIAALLGDDLGIVGGGMAGGAAERGLSHMIGSEKQSALGEKAAIFSMMAPKDAARQAMGKLAKKPAGAPLSPPGWARKTPPPIPADAPRPVMKLRGVKVARLNNAFTEGMQTAISAFRKEAFLPLLGAIAGPALARAGLGRLAAGAGGKMLQGVAGKVAPRVAHGLGSGAFDMAGSIAGQTAGQKLTPQQPQP